MSKICLHTCMWGLFLWVYLFMVSSCEVPKTRTMSHLYSAMYAQNIVQPVLLSFLQQEGNIIFQQDNACPQYPFYSDNFISYWTCIDNTWLIQLAQLQLLLCCINSYKRFWIMYCIVVFALCVITCMQKYISVSTSQGIIQCINMISEYWWYTFYCGILYLYIKSWLPLICSSLPLK